MKKSKFKDEIKRMGIDRLIKRYKLTPEQAYDITKKLIKQLILIYHPDKAKQKNKKIILALTNILNELKKRERFQVIYDEIVECKEKECIENKETVLLKQKMIALEKENERLKQTISSLYYDFYNISLGKRKELKHAIWLHKLNVGDLILIKLFERPGTFGPIFHQKETEFKIIEPRKIKGGNKLFLLAGTYSYSPGNLTISVYNINKYILPMPWITKKSILIGKEIKKDSKLQIIGMVKKIIKKEQMKQKNK